MKKKFMLVISLLVALCMCFALFACGNGNGDKVVEYTEEKAQASVESLLSAKSLKGKVKQSVKENGTEQMQDAVPQNIEVRGRQVLISTPVEISGVTVDQGYLLDLDTGYFFSAASAQGVSMSAPIEQTFAAGFFDYAEKAFAADVTESDVSVDLSAFTYDDSSRSMKATYDVADKVNDLFKPAQTVYTNNGSLTDVINGYLSKAFGEYAPTVSGILTLVQNGVAQYKNMTFEEMVPYINPVLDKVQTGLTVQDVMTALGYDTTVYNDIKDRTLGEMIEGLIGFVESVMPASNGSVDTQAGEGSGMSEVDIQQMAAAFFESVFASTVDTTNLEQDLETYATELTDFLDGTKFKPLIDELPSDYDVIKAIISNNISFERYGMEMVVSFDNSLNINGVTVSSFVKHNYSGTSTDAFLKAKDIVSSVILEIESYSATAEPFDYPFMTGADAAQLPVPDFAMSIVCGQEQGDYKVLYETGGKTVAVSQITPYVLAPDPELDGVYTEIDVAYTGTSVTYDAQTKTFTFNRSYVDAAVAAGGVYVGANFKVVSGSQHVDAKVEVKYYATYNTDAVVEMVADFIASLANVNV